MPPVSGRRASLGRPLLFCGQLCCTIVRVDGFNLYFGCLKATPWKWLDLVALSKGVLIDRL